VLVEERLEACCATTAQEGMTNESVVIVEICQVSWGGGQSTVPLRKGYAAQDTLGGQRLCSLLSHEGRVCPNHEVKVSLAR